MWNRNRSILPVKRPRATTPSPSRSPSPEEDDVPLRELVREKAAAQNGPQRESLAEKPAAAVERAVPRSAEKLIVREPGSTTCALADTTNVPDAPLAAASPTTTPPGPRKHTVAATTAAVRPTSRSSSSTTMSFVPTSSSLQTQMNEAVAEFPSLAPTVSQLFMLYDLTSRPTEQEIDSWASALHAPVDDIKRWLPWKRARDGKNDDSPRAAKRIKISHPSSTPVINVPQADHNTPVNVDTVKAPSPTPTDNSTLNSPALAIGANEPRVSIPSPALPTSTSSTQSDLTPQFLPPRAQLLPHSAAASPPTLFVNPNDIHLRPASQSSFQQNSSAQAIAATSGSAPQPRPWPPRISVPVRYPAQRSSSTTPSSATPSAHATTSTPSSRTVTPTELMRPSSVNQKLSSPSSSTPRFFSAAAISTHTLPEQRISRPLSASGLQNRVHLNQSYPSSSHPPPAAFAQTQQPLLSDEPSARRDSAGSTSTQSPDTPQTALFPVPADGSVAPRPSPVVPNVGSFVPSPAHVQLALANGIQQYFYPSQQQAQPQPIQQQPLQQQQQYRHPQQPVYQQQQPVYQQLHQQPQSVQQQQQHHQQLVQQQQPLVPSNAAVAGPGPNTEAERQRMLAAYRQPVHPVPPQVNPVTALVAGQEILVMPFPHVYFDPATGHPYAFDQAGNTFRVTQRGTIYPFPPSAPFRPQPTASVFFPPQAHYTQQLEQRPLPANVLTTQPVPQPPGAPAQQGLQKRPTAQRGGVHGGFHFLKPEELETLPPDRQEGYVVEEYNFWSGRHSELMLAGGTAADKDQCVSGMEGVRKWLRRLEAKGYALRVPANFCGPFLRVGATPHLRPRGPQFVDLTSPVLRVSPIVPEQATSAPTAPVAALQLQHAQSAIPPVERPDEQLHLEPATHITTQATFPPLSDDERMQQRQEVFAYLDACARTAPDADGAALRPPALSFASDCVSRGDRRAFAGPYVQEWQTVNRALLERGGHALRERIRAHMRSVLRAPPSPETPPGRLPLSLPAVARHAVGRSHTILTPEATPEPTARAVVKPTNAEMADAPPVSSAAPSRTENAFVKDLLFQVRRLEAPLHGEMEPDEEYRALVRINSGRWGNVDSVATLEAFLQPHTDRANEMLAAMERGELGHLGFAPAY